MLPKPLLAALLILPWVSMAQLAAQPTPQARARSNASSFLHHVRPQAVLSSSAVHCAALPWGATGADSAAYYVFDIAGDGGFVIASGDDRAVPVLGYVEQGHFCQDSLPANMAAWLQGYAEELAWAEANGYQAGDVAGDDREDVSYMVPTLWGQGSPFNADCTFANTTCYTGCVATAMAQVMYYWGVVQGYEHGSTALASYKTSTRGYTVSALEALDAFDWGNMLTSYTSSSSEAAQAAVAQLMRYCGQSVEMDYTSTGSGASDSPVAAALRNYFAYDEGTHLVARSSLTSTGWDSLIYAEMAAGRPVYMSGVDGDEMTGHAFVCDGYQASTGLYHFNWGWKGNYDGYFALEALQPGGTGTGGTSSSLGDYSVWRYAVVGIRQPTGEAHATQPYDLLTVAGLYLTGDSLLSRSDRHEDAGEATLLGIIVNNTGETVTLDYDYGLFTGDGTLLDTFDAGGTATVMNGYGAYYSASLSLGALLPYDTYTIALVGRLRGESDWQLMDGASKHYVQAVVGDTTVLLRPAFRVEASVVSQPSGTAYENLLCLHNTGTEELSTTFVAVVDGNVSQYMESYAAAGAYDTIALNYTGLIEEGGTFVVRDVYAAVLPFVADTTYADVEWDMRWDGYIDDSNRLYDDTYSARLIVSNKGNHTYRHDATVTLFPYGGSVAQGTSATLAVDLSPHSSGSYAFAFDDMEAGVTYDLQLTYYEGSGQTTVLLSNYGCALTATRGTVIRSPAGLTYYPDEDGVTVPDDAYYVDLRYSGAVGSLTPGDGGSTLYVLPEGRLHITALTDRNTVFGSEATSLAVDVGDGFLTPVSFTATTATATFTPVREGWQPLALPFAVSDLPDGLIVEGLSAVEGDTLFFTPATDMDAYQPYLVYVSADRVDTQMAFTATDADVAAETLARTRVGDVDLVVALDADTVHLAYALSDDAGTLTFSGEDVAVGSLEAYAIRYTNPSEEKPLFVVHTTDTTTGIQRTRPVRAADEGATYSLQGMRVEGLLRPGIYLRDGKKYLIR